MRVFFTAAAIAIVIAVVMGFVYGGIDLSSARMNSTQYARLGNAV